MARSPLQRFWTRIEGLLAVTPKRRAKFEKRQMKDLRSRSGAIREEDGRRLFDWSDGGTVDKAAYARAQTIGNRAKIDSQWVQEDHIATLAAYVTDRLGEVRRGVCHGTRRGNEQAWFRQHLTGPADVFGTEISDTAIEFPNTIQWDFHERNPDWVGAFDLVYSNSWDHAYDPALALRGWAETLAPGGIMLLDHSQGHLPDMVDALDPFGTTIEGLRDLLARECAEFGQVVDVIEPAEDTEVPIRTVVFAAHAKAA